MDVVTPPTVLVATGNWWALAGRIAIAFGHHGWNVVAACPPHSPLTYVKCVREAFTLNALSSRSALITAIRKTRPHLIVPCDDSTVFLLQEIHGEHPDLREVIERSLGNPDAFAVTHSRDALQRMAAELGIRVPRSAAVDSAQQAAERFADFAQAAVVKLDGTYGGEGVSVVRTRDDAAEAFRQAQSATTALVAAKRALINRDPYAFWAWQRKGQARVTMQQFIVGAPANIMVACWQGQVLGQVSVEALSCQGATGAANIVRRVARADFAQAASALAARLKLSGFFGLDFMIERDTDRAYLIEMNPRCTQLGHLQFEDQDSLVCTLSAQVAGLRSAASALTVREAVIAFFPQAWRWKLAGPEWSSAFHDIPWGEDALIKALLGEAWPDRLWLARLYHWFRPPQQAVAADFQNRSRDLLGDPQRS
jgi:carbamoyl-phosphate synthase L subunit-like protein